MNNIKKLDRYIDELNNEKRPLEHGKKSYSDEYRKLTETARLVKTLKDMEYPDEQYEKMLIGKLIRDINYKENNKLPKLNRYSGKRIIKRSMVITAAVAAAALVIFSAAGTFSRRNNNIAYAIEKAIETIKAYHGIIEYTESNMLGETVTQSRKEVWADKQGNYYVKELEGFNKGAITVNNGKIKWQLREQEQNAYIFQTFPDPYRFTFELGSELEDVKKALTVKEIGEETVSGREAIVFEITPASGEPYRLWVDKENKLPLQRVSAMQNALMYKVSYSFIEFIDALPIELMTYELPDGFTEINNNPEQLVASIEEAMEITDIQIIIPDKIPEGYALDKIAAIKSMSAIKLYYIKENNTIQSNESNQAGTTVVVSQSKAEGELKPDISSILGEIGSSKAEVISNELVNSVRWQQQGMEYNVLGNDNMDIIKAFIQSMTDGEIIIPTKDTSISGKPQIEVDIDLEAEENTQKSVDAGHSPWKLDPVFVTQVFASLLLSPEGIVGDYPIPYDAITITENNGVEAIAIINDEKSIARTVYLKRLVRQDDSGIWTVIGYDINTEG